MKIEDKKIMQQLLEKGSFGNTVKFWSNPKDVRKDGYKGSIWFRVSGKNASNVYKVPNKKLEKVFKDLQSAIEKDGWVVIGEEVPEVKRIFSGEITHLPKNSDLKSGLYLYYSLKRKPIREALNYFPETELYDDQVLSLLEKHLEPDDKKHLLGLLENYPHAVVEFSYFKKPLGTQNKKLIIWEVRHY